MSEKTAGVTMSLIAWPVEGQPRAAPPSLIYSAISVAGCATEITEMLCLTMMNAIWKEIRTG